MKTDRAIDYTRLWDSSYNDFLLRAMKRFIAYFSLPDVPSSDAPEHYSYKKSLSYYAGHFGVNTIAIENQFDRLYLRTPILARNKKTNKPVLLLPCLGLYYQVIDDTDQNQSVVSVKDIAKHFDNLVQLFPVNFHDASMKGLKTALRIFYPSFFVFMLAIIFALLSLAFLAASSLAIDVTTTNRLPLSLVQITSTVFIVICLILTSIATTKKYGLFIVFFCHHLFRSISAFFETDILWKDYFRFEQQAQLVFLNGYKIIFALTLLISMAMLSIVVLPPTLLLVVLIADVLFMLLSTLYAMRIRSHSIKKSHEFKPMHNMLFRIRDSLPISFGLKILDASINRLQNSHKKFSDVSIEHWYVSKVAQCSYFFFPLMTLALMAMVIGDDESIPLWKINFGLMIAISSSVIAAYIGFKVYEYVTRNQGLIASEKLDQSARRVQLVRMLGSLELDHISFAYERTGQIIFKDYSLALKSGQLSIIQGPSGSGKTTLLKIMMGFISPQIGRVIYDGHDLRSLDMSALRSKFGVMFDKAQVFSGSVYDNIVCGRSLTNSSMRKLLLSHEIFDGLIDMPMGLSTYIVEHGKNISTYEKFLILFARAMVHKPTYIFIDDALSALANDDQKRVMNYLIAREATCVITSPRRIDYDDQVSTIIDLPCLEPRQ